MNASISDTTIGFRMTALEDDLIGVRGDEVKSCLLERLAKKTKDLRELMKTGLSPEVYDAAECAHAGIAAAYDVVCRLPANKKTNSEDLA
ncbi:hypothetical protein PDO_4656 [Rhizobium sp. PDO1-076]|uniref:EscE/YscE/SsaE family type III secretion system needle protein co-chaperone n=1 Tax=Rhizobium sp. PDO1-076 TaxID=1125979 RepID=UPI00024E3912|nr:EscE/YscE/SsaE family type III secretion system needle protein co-chaperone [Rhizobium sp. PDO1-076]EHS52678.1 hypothetical protein PDO_4656 [Rhizobium sp. PDO1-076]